jgi:ABC-type glycerol-3-phosphate transport system permease component
MKKITDIFYRLFGSVKGNELFFKGITTLILAAGAVVIMIPLAFMVSTSLKDQVRREHADSPQAADRRDQRRKI